jgi:hypothetical protein
MKVLSFSVPSSGDFVVEALGDELLIYDRRKDVAHCLGSAAALVWRTCEGGASLDEIARQTVAYGMASTDEDAIELAQAAVSELEEKGLLESRGVGADGVSRRHALRQMAGVGAAAVVAPLVVSAAVPKPADAAGSPATCASGNKQCSPAGTVNADNNCCPGAGTLNLYCAVTPPSKCQPCVLAGNAPTDGTTCATLGAANYTCCSGHCSATTAGVCG